MLPSVRDYLPEHAPGLLKLALPDPPPEDEPKKEHSDNELPTHPALHAAKTIGGGLLGFGLGTLAGQGLHSLAERANVPMGPVAKAAPALGGLFGAAYHMYKQKELEELQHALESYKHQSRGQRLGE